MLISWDPNDHGMQSKHVPSNSKCPTSFIHIGNLSPREEKGLSDIEDSPPLEVDSTVGILPSSPLVITSI